MVFSIGIHFKNKFLAMLNRRHFRVKVMQTIYAMHQHQSDALDKEEKFYCKVLIKLKIYIC